MKILLADIVRKTGAKSESKVRQMRNCLRNGGKLPPIRVALVDNGLREYLGRMGLSATKKYFLLEGHHRCCASELEGKKTIDAKVVRKLW